jgi:hypothetical protein
MSPVIQLLEQITKQQYKIKALAGNQVKFQPKTSECYVTIPKGLAKKRIEFHAYKLKEDRSYREVFENMHHTINSKQIKTETMKLGYMVTNIWNIKQYPSQCSL